MTFNNITENSSRYRSGSCKLQRIALIDGYVDEPSCLGVPPYVSPYIRYSYGALLERGMDEEQIDYITIDQLRNHSEYRQQLLDSSDVVVIIAGTTVPGRYLGGKPISLAEMKDISQTVRGEFLVGGPVVMCDIEMENVFWLDETGALGLYQYLADDHRDSKSTDIIAGNNIENFAQNGAKLIVRHPDYPHLVCELETYRGCLRRGSCQFCSESLKQVLYSRTSEDISKEVESLYLKGARHFRLGAQTDLFLYGATDTDKGLTPNPQAIEKLYSSIREVAPELHTLHMDNVNPSTIARFPEESREIMKTVVKYNTPGDTAAFGLESCDPRVLQMNNIGTTPDETWQAIEVMNQEGGIMENSQYKLLPGINLLYGLQGQSDDTYELNYKFLKNVLDRDLLLRRINLRQVREIAGYRGVKVNNNKFQKHKEQVNREINYPMLQRVFPQGTILEKVKIEKQEGYISYGRQLGTYPILVGIPGTHNLGELLDVKIIDHGYRSLTGLTCPVNINDMKLEELQSLPGVGKKRASHLMVNQPISGPEKLWELLQDRHVFDQVSNIIDKY